MPEYIDREAAVLEVKRYLMPNVDVDGTVSVEDAERYFLRLLEEQPAADVVEVRHGHWNTTDTILGRCCECSVCGSCPTMEYRYCPYCGAKMDGKGEGE